MGSIDLHTLGQRLWLDNITRDLLDSGTLARYLRDFHISGLTSNPSIFDAALANSTAYDDDIRRLTGQVTGLKTDQAASDEDVLIRIALDDLRRAADLFRPQFDASEGQDGWVSMEISPLLAHDSNGSIQAAREIHQLAERPNLLVKIPGTEAGITAIDATVTAGIPVNVTLLFSLSQYEAAADAYLRALERRLESGLDLRVMSVASIFISRWDVATPAQTPPELRGQLGIAMAGRINAAYHRMLTTPRWRRLADAGARPQRLLWASTGNKDPNTPVTRYADALAVPGSINTLPESTLLALNDTRSTPPAVSVFMTADGLAAEACLERFVVAGLDLDALATQLQQAGVQSFVKSWHSLLGRIASRRSAKSTSGAP